MHRTWLRNPRFDVALQLGALAGILPALLVYAALGTARGASVLPLALLIALPFLHVFGSFFFAFSEERNRSASSPRWLLGAAAVWIVVSSLLQAVTSRGLATFALLYGGWHILRQNFGFLRELAGRAGLGADRGLRRLDLAACLAPAVALWLLVADRGPWTFMGADVYHLAVPRWLLALAFVAIPATCLFRERRIAGRANARTASLLILAGNAGALVGPALFLDDLTIVYTLAASFHGIQYLAYLADRQRAVSPHTPTAQLLAPMASMIVLCTIGWLLLLALLMWLLPQARVNQAVLLVWYAAVPFHYFVDGRIWRRPRALAAAAP